METKNEGAAPPRPPTDAGAPLVGPWPPVLVSVAGGMTRALCSCGGYYLRVVPVSLTGSEHERHEFLQCTSHDNQPLDARSGGDPWAAVQAARAEIEELRAAALRYVWVEYMPWISAGGGEECEHGVNMGIDCRECDRSLLLEGKRRKGNARVSAPSSAVPLEAGRTGNDPDYEGEDQP